MVNEITVSIFIAMLTIDGALVLLAFLGGKLPNHINIISSVLATTLTFVLSHSILNGNVVIVKSDDTFLPIQSLPIFYFLEGIAVFLVIFTAFLIYTAIKEGFEQHSVFEGMTEE